MPYEYLEDIAVADIAFEARGQTIEEMFIAAADATMNVMVADLSTIERRESREFEVEDDALDLLLFALLQEIIFFKDAELLLLRLEEVKIKSGDGVFSAKARARGEQIDPLKHDLQVDVKAVTLHMFRVEETPEGWESLVVLDI